MDKFAIRTESLHVTYALRGNERPSHVVPTFLLQACDTLRASCEQADSCCMNDRRTMAMLLCLLSLLAFLGGAQAVCATQRSTDCYHTRQNII
jgi:hypothetical protein